MPRVLLTGFCAVPGPRRAGVQLRHVIRALTPHHTVDLLVVREGEQAYVERQGSVRVLRVPSQDVDMRAQIHAFQRALKRQLEGAEYDIVHCRDAWAGTTVIEARERLGYAVVYDLSRSPLGEPWFEQDLDAQYARDEDACLVAADLVLVPTPDAVHALDGIGPPNRVMLSPPGVDVDRFDWDDPTTGGPPKILYAGAIDPGRGVRVLIRAMAAIVRELDARLVLAGPVAPGFDQQLKDGIRELGLTDKVELPGVVDHDQIPALIATATVCVVPQAADLAQPTAGFPTKLLEYLACRRAVVAARRDTISQVVDDERDALLFEPGDPLDLAHHVLRLLKDPAMRARIANAGYERVRREFTASAARRAVRNAYALVAERFHAQFTEDHEDPSPKVEMLTDDEFEATVFEDGVPVAPVDTEVKGMRTAPVNAADALEEALSSLDEGTSSGVVAAPPASPSAADETSERSPVPPGPAVAGNWTPRSPSQSAAQPVERLTDRLTSPSLPRITGSIEILSELVGDDTGSIADEGTPAEGSIAVAGPPVVESNFVAGEIDIPTPRPAPVARPARGDSADDAEPHTPQIELLPDPDTGSRTPPLERR